MTARKAESRLAHAELARLDQAVADARRRADDTRRRAAEALKDLPTLEQAERELWGQGDEEGAEEARVRRAELLGEAESWKARILGADQAVEKAQTARRAFVDDRGDALVAEAEPEAEAARARVENALRELTAAHVDYQQTKTRLDGCVHYQRHRPDDPALQAVAMAADRVLSAGVAAPMPAPPGVEEAVA